MCVGGGELHVWKARDSEFPLHDPLSIYRNCHSLVTFSQDFFFLFFYLNSIFVCFFLSRVKLRMFFFWHFFMFSPSIFVARFWRESLWCVCLSHRQRRNSWFAAIKPPLLRSSSSETQRLCAGGIYHTISRFYPRKAYRRGKKRGLLFGKLR